MLKYLSISLQDSLNVPIFAAEFLKNRLKYYVTSYFPFA